MIGVIICLAIIALAECACVYNQFRNTHLADEIGRLEGMLLSERGKFEKYQENVLKEMVELKNENKHLRGLVCDREVSSSNENENEKQSE